MLRSEQQLPSVSSETFYEPHFSKHKSKSNEEKKALVTPGNSTSGGYGGKTKTNSVLFFLPRIFNSALPLRASQGQRNKLLINSTD